MGFLAIGKRIFGGKLRVISMPVLIFGILAILTPNESKSFNHEINLSSEMDSNNLETSRSSDEENNLSLDYRIGVTYKIENNQYIPIRATSFMNGLILGYDYELKSFHTEPKLKGEKADYTANGMLHWNLLGFKIYSQFKEINGRI